VLDAKVSLTGAPNESDQSTRDRYEKEQEEIKSEAEHKEARCEIKLSQARSVRARRDHVPNRDCHRGNLRTYKETLFLVCEFGLRCCRLCVSSPRVDGAIGLIPQGLAPHDHGMPCQTAWNVGATPNQSSERDTRGSRAGQHVRLRSHILLKNFCEPCRTISGEKLEERI
jgi:hypothetical protein